MDFDIQQKINAQLNPGERILWTGHPRGGLVFRGSDIPFTLFGIIWLSFVLTAAFNALTFEEIPIPVLVVLVPFLAIGLYIVLFRFLHDAWRRSRTYYSLTDRRVIIVTGWFKLEVMSLSLRTLPGMSLSEKSDGSGTIQLGTSRSGFGWPSSMYWPGTSSRIVPSLELVQDVRSVYNQILQTHERGFQGN
ncbi:MAG: hypothetical protein AB1483_03015 [Candidatus Zixiibacteriota bacterium]